MLVEFNGGCGFYRDHYDRSSSSSSSHAAGAASEASILSFVDGFGFTAGLVLSLLVNVGFDVSPRSENRSLVTAGTTGGGAEAAAPEAPEVVPAPAPRRGLGFRARDNPGVDIDFAEDPIVSLVFF